MNSIKRLIMGLLITFTVVVWADPSDPDYVTVEQIEASLVGVPPMVVGFDVDDTVIFSSPVFYHMVTTYCDGVYPGCSTSTKDYWKIANQLDTFSLPKQVGLGLVQMHLERGDTVYFITARTGSKHEKVTAILRHLLNAPDLAPVIFASHSSETNTKVPYIKNLNIQIYYGDSDNDMRAAFDPSNPIRGIRMLRASNSLESYFSPVTIGLFNEEVVIGSEN